MTIAVLVVYALRLRAATRPQLRALIAVAVTSLLFLPAFFVYQFSRLVLEADAQTLDALQWGIVATRILLPLGFLAALWQAEIFAGASLGRLLQRLATRPTLEQWRDDIAAALDDPPLQIGYSEPVSGVLRQADGSELTPPPPGSGRGGYPPIGTGRRWR